MSGDKPLDEFAGDRSEPDGSEPDGRSQSDSADGSEPDADASDTSAAVSTSTWHADGADCDRCGARADRRWRDGDALVCADCAPW